MREDEQVLGFIGAIFVIFIGWVLVGIAQNNYAQATYYSRQYEIQQQQDRYYTEATKLLEDKKKEVEKE